MKYDNEIVSILKSYEICYLCNGLRIVKDLDNNPYWKNDKPKNYLKCLECNGRGYYKKNINKLI